MARAWDRAETLAFTGSRLKAGMTEKNFAVGVGESGVLVIGAATLPSSLSGLTRQSATLPGVVKGFLAGRGVGTSAVVHGSVAGPRVKPEDDEGERVVRSAAALRFRFGRSRLKSLHWSDLPHGTALTPRVKPEDDEVEVLERAPRDCGCGSAALDSGNKSRNDKLDFLAKKIFQPPRVIPGFIPGIQKPSSLSFQ